MAKRKRLATPSADELSALEQSLISDRPTRSPGISAPPIAQVAAEAAQAALVASPTERAERARLAAEAERLRLAEEQGLLISELPLSRIRLDHMTRDRVDLDESAMDELVASIRQSGMRLPIEVCALGKTDGVPAYGLISGYRRFRAVERIAEADGTDAPLIRALVRPATDRASGLVAMVEENEIRSDLTPYERGRIAVIAVRDGTFESLEAAVNALFGSASKAKRSKIRSFARVFDELGDRLQFGPALKETEGLALASALKSGQGKRLRAALGEAKARTANDESGALKTALSPREGPGKAPKAAAPTPPTPTETVHICKGVSMRYHLAGDIHQLRFRGERVDEDLMFRLMGEVERYLKDQLEGGIRP